MASSPPHLDREIPPGPYDLVVVGGGINGAAIAREAVLRGKSVALFERGDLASGTSSASSKMIHGGIRYLEQLRLGLVYESLAERHRLIRLAPHLVQPQDFVLPIREGQGRPPWQIRIGLWLYDLLAIGRRLGRSRSLTPSEVVGLLPELAPDGLAGGGVYQDAVMDDARLVVENAVAAATEARERRVPFVLRTYCEVIDHRPTQPTELTVRDGLTGKTARVFAHKVIEATGPWTERELIAPSKGVHLVLPPFPWREGVLLQHSKDGRVFFVVPWRGLTVVGTTETPFEGDPGDVRATEDDVSYLASELRRVFPGLAFGSGDILGVFAGVRPLARSPRGPFGGKKSLGDVSRSHRIVESSPGVFQVFGGKYTTYRVIARDAVRRALGGSSVDTRKLPLPGGKLGPWDSFRSQLPAETSPELAAHLWTRYGARSLDVLAIARSEPGAAEPLVPGAPDLRAEVLYAVRHEFVRVPADFLDRRTRLRYAPGRGRAAYDVVDAILRAQLTAPPDVLDAARKRYFESRDVEDRLAAVVDTLAPVAP